MSISEQIRSAREAARLSKTELASQMCELGFAWTYLQVNRLEKGERALQWEEGKALQALIQFDSDHADVGVRRDAKAYRDILRVIGAREAVEIPAVTS